MESAEVLVAALTIVVCLCMTVLYGFFIFWTFRFLSSVPQYLKRIAESLDRIEKQ